MQWRTTGNDNVITLHYDRITPIGRIRVMTLSTTKTRRETLNLRIPPAERNLIDRAAESAGKTRTEFILGAARRAAEEALLDRALMVVSPQAYAAFVQRLDQPPRPNDRLQRTMRAPAPWRAA